LRRRRLPDVELEVVACRERPEALIAAIGNNGLEPGQVLDLVADQFAPDFDIVRLGRIHSDGDRQPENVNQDAALGSDRAPAGVVEG
jgi:hypothetical protein